MDAEGHRFPIKVYWEDTDAGGVVYHAAYLRFAERARSEMLAAQGVDQWASLQEEGWSLAVREMKILFNQPARLGDSLEVVTKIHQTSGASVWLEQLIRKGETVLSSLILQIVCVNRRGRAVRLPQSVRDALS